MFLHIFCIMRKIIFSILSVIIWFFWFTFAALEFTNYQVLWQIKNDGTIDVQENIDVHFFDQMHGIERKFDNSYTVQDIEFATVVDNISIPDYNYSIIDDYYQKNIRIWDADVYVDWDKSYEIDYDIYWLIRNFSGKWYAELYRNVIWYWRSNSINNVQIELTLPKAYTWLTKDDFLISAGYTDKYSIDDFPWIVTRDENKIYITYNHKLSPYEWITLAVKFPNWYFDFDHEKQENLLVWYTHDFNIKNYKINWIIDKSGNMTFQNEIELEILNSGCDVRAQLPYRYVADWNDFLTQLKDVEINGVKKDIEEYDTTNLSSIFLVPWEFLNDTTISGNYSIYGLIRPFSWEYEDRAYRLYLPLPTMYLFEDIENLEVTLDVPWGCETIYKEDVSVNYYWKIIWLDEYNEKHWKIRCRDNKLMMTFSWELSQNDKLGLYINFVEWTFDLDEELLTAFAAIWDWDFYYTDKTNRQSILFALWILLFWWWFKALMNKRYKSKARVNEKYVIQYDAPKWIDAPEAGVLIDNKLDSKDITSMIYQRAANHYIKIYKEEDDEKKFYIKKLKDIPEDSKEYQLKLFNILFKDWDEYHFSQHRSSFSFALTDVYSKLNSYINKQNWFKNTFFSGIWSSFKRQNRVIIFWTAILWFIPYFAVITSLTNHFVPVSNRIRIIVFIAFILIVTSYRNYKEETNTTKGQELRKYCQWFKDFLMKVDKVKLETLLKEDPLYIEKVLPYAVVFWVESQFINSITPEQIKDLSRFNGDWYELENAIRYINRYNALSLYSYSGGSSSSSSSSRGSYSSSWWFSSGSSFGWWFSSWWGGGGGWWGWR